MIPNFYKINLLAVVLCFVVVTVGAYVRLSDAGLGCPDWPGCYGHLVGVPEQSEHVAAANQAFPERPVEAGKAWKEMIHRYLAGILGLLILCMALLAWRRVISPPHASHLTPHARVQWRLPTVLLGLVIFQALLGMWTVTLLLKPLIVSAHLLGGMAILALLLLCLLRRGEHLRAWTAHSLSRLRAFAGVALAVLIGQIFLGAWTSTNYAALACPDFPTCQGVWWPETDFATAFTLWHGLGMNYEYGILDSVPRATIHLTHRIGAIVTSAVLLGLAASLHARGRDDGRWRKLAGLLVAALLLQIILGVSTVLGHLPLPLAVAHNGGAALLLLTVMAITHAVWSATPGRGES